MSEFNKRLEHFYTVINARQIRERALVFFAVTGLMIFVWIHLVFKPLDISKKKVENDRQRAEQEFQDAQNLIQSVMQEMQNDPSKELTAQITLLGKEMTTLDKQLNVLTANLISPKAMATVLQEVLKRLPNLSIVKFENLPAISLVSNLDKSAHNVNVVDLYKHGLSFEFTGQYFSTLYYLKMLENLGVRFIWESLDYTVKDYPSATIKLVVRTLSKQEGLLGG